MDRVRRPSGAEPKAQGALGFVQRMVAGASLLDVTEVGDRVQEPFPADRPWIKCESVDGSQPVTLVQAESVRITPLTSHPVSKRALA